MPALCRNGRHPYSQRRTKTNGLTTCVPCEQESWRASQPLRSHSTTGWASLAPDPERQERYDAWAAGLDAAIAMVRATEGFDGGERPWQALGEYLPLPSPARAPRRRAITQMVVRCADCDTPRLWDAPCATCAQRRMASPPVSRYPANAPRSVAARRFQALAARDVGRLVS